MKFFYIFAVGWLAILYLGDSDTDMRVRDATFMLVALLAFAVAAISQRIDRAVKQIKDPDFNVAAANRKDWFEVGQMFFAVIAIIVLGTAVQGAVRCLSSGNELSASCVWDGIWRQVDEDLN